MSAHDDQPAPRRRSQTPAPREGHDAASGALTAGRATSAELKRLRAEHRELLASWEYAFAMGHGCTIGDDPRLAAVRERAARLQARIQELTRSTARRAESDSSDRPALDVQALREHQRHRPPRPQQATRRAWHGAGAGAKGQHASHRTAASARRAKTERTLARNHDKTDVKAKRAPRDHPPSTATRASPRPAAANRRGEDRRRKALPRQVLASEVC
jgi:hypothetical protein